MVVKPLVSEVFIGDNEVFECSAVETILWKFNGYNLPQNAKVVWDKLIIRNASIKNEGSYTCEGFSENGSPVIGRGELFLISAYKLSCLSAK